jgi:hypothetical protein
MAEAYIVHLDLEQLRVSRSQVEQRDLTDDDVQNWLVKYGFYPRIDGLYLAEESVLRQLDPDSILDVQPVESD